MRPNDILTAAADLIEKGWTQGALATDSSNHLVLVQSPAACKFCMVGAMVKASKGKATDTYREAMEKALSHVRTRGFYSVSSYNDEPCRTQAEAIATLREAANA